MSGVTLRSAYIGIFYSSIGICAGIMTYCYAGAAPVLRQLFSDFCLHLLWFRCTQACFSLSLWPAFTDGRVKNALVSIAEKSSRLIDLETNFSNGWYFSYTHRNPNLNKHTHTMTLTYIPIQNWPGSSFMKSQAALSARVLLFSYAVTFALSVNPQLSSVIGCFPPGCPAMMATHELVSTTRFTVPDWLAARSTFSVPSLAGRINSSSFFGWAKGNGLAAWIT